MGRHPTTKAQSTPKAKAKGGTGRGRKAKKNDDAIPVLPDEVQAKYKEQWQQFTKSTKTVKDCWLGLVGLGYVTFTEFTDLFKSL